MFMEKRCGRIDDHDRHDWQTPPREEAWFGKGRIVRSWFTCLGKVLIEGGHSGRH